jgi:hypothetical protein
MTPRQRFAPVGLCIVASVALRASPISALPPGAGEADRTLHRVVTLDAPRPVRIDLRYGDVRIESGSPGRVEAELTIHCRHDSKRCAEHVEEIDLEADSSGDRLRLRVVGLPRFSNHGTGIELRVLVPPGFAVDADVGAGRIEVVDVDGDLRVDLGAGEIQVRMPEEAVRSVEARAGVGEARLSRDGTTLAQRRHLVGGHVEWDSGTGEASVDLGVGAGEVAVRLE